MIHYDLLDVSRSDQTISHMSSEKIYHWHVCSEVQIYNSISIKRSLRKHNHAQKHVVGEGFCKDKRNKQANQ